METQHDKLWSAYLDGELSATEADRFDESLTEGERERLAAETHFERALSEKLDIDARCPDEVWQHTERLVRSAASRRPLAGLRHWIWRIGAAAAAVLLFIWILNPKEAPILNHVRTVAELKRLSQVPAGIEAAQQYLNDQGVKLRLDPFETGASDQHHHEALLLGARTLAYNGERVIQLLYVCCGEPIEVTLARQDTAAAEALRQAVDSGAVKTARVVGDYLAVPLGMHPAEDILGHIGEV